jgi:ABC-type glycerol-3-phosphate transport system permease component
VPLVAPGMASAALLTFLAIWNEFLLASILASLPSILLVAVLQRYLIRGLLAGALRE